MLKIAQLVLVFAQFFLKILPDRYTSSISSETHAFRCLFAARRRFRGNHIPADIAVEARTLFVYVGTKRKVKSFFAQRNLISKELTYLYHVKTNRAESLD